MNLKALATSTLIGLASVVPFAQPAAAESTFRFNKDIGSLYVHYAKVRTRNGRTEAMARVTIPRCDSRHYLAGEIRMSYFSPNGGYFHNYLLGGFDSRRKNYEGATLNLYTEYGNPLNTSGRVRINQNLSCYPLDNRRRLRVPTLKI